jgi:hypothetical protein
MELTIVNPHPKYSSVGLIEPPATGYSLLAAVVVPPLGPTPFPTARAAEGSATPEMKALAGSLEQLETVSEATVYRAAIQQADLLQLRAGQHAPEPHRRLADPLPPGLTERGPAT